MPPATLPGDCPLAPPDTDERDHSARCKPPCCTEPGRAIADGLDFPIGMARGRVAPCTSPRRATASEESRALARSCASTFLTDPNGAGPRRTMRRGPRFLRRAATQVHPRLMCPLYSKTRLTTSSLNKIRPVAPAKPPVRRRSDGGTTSISSANVSSTYFAVNVYVVSNVPHVEPFRQPTKTSVPCSWYVPLGLSFEYGRVCVPAGVEASRTGR